MHLANYIHLFNRLYKFPHRRKSTSIPPRVQDIVAEATSNVEGSLMHFLMHILPNSVIEPTIAALINRNQFVSGNLMSVASNLRRGRNGYRVLNMTAE